MMVNLHPAARATAAIILFFFFSDQIKSQVQQWDKQQNIVQQYDFAPEHNPHLYRLKTHLCDLNTSSSCTLDNAFQLMLSDSKFIAPTYGSQEVRHQGVLFVMLSLPGVNVPGLHPIKTYIDRANHTVTNYTLPGHLLHPGQVERKIIQEGNSLFLLTAGLGYSNFSQFISGTPACIENPWLAILARSVADLGANTISSQAADLNKDQCIIDFVWVPVHKLFVDKMTSLQTTKVQTIPAVLSDKPIVASDNTSSQNSSQGEAVPILDNSAIWHLTFPNEKNFDSQGRLTRLGKNKSEIKTQMFASYDYATSEGIKTIILFYTNSYTNGIKDECHACYPIMSIARFLKKNDEYRLEKFEEKFEGSTGSWGNGPRILNKFINGKHVLRLEYRDSHFGNNEVEVSYYNLETFKKENIKE